jgi:hypothetical protein
MIEQSPWRGDEDIGTFTQSVLLLAIANSSIHQRDPKISESG